MLMSQAKSHQGLEFTNDEAGAGDGTGDIRATLGEAREQLEEVIRLQFAQAEKALAARVQERLASADALIARLTAENAMLNEKVTRWQEESAKHERTLARLRELALASP